MAVKSCPECKSHNTRQMDKEHYPDQAYCLSCYCRYKSVVGNPAEIKSIKPVDRGLVRITERLERIERSLKVAQKELLDLCKEQKETGGALNGKRSY